MHITCIPIIRSTEVMTVIYCQHAQFYFKVHGTTSVQKTFITFLRGRKDVIRKVSFLLILKLLRAGSVFVYNAFCAESRMALSCYC